MVVEENIELLILLDIYYFINVLILQLVKFFVHTFLQNTEGAAGYAPDLDHHMEETMKWAESVVSKSKSQH